MNPVSPEQVALATGAPISVARSWAPALNSAMQRFDISTPKRQAAFLAQIGHESGGLEHLVESLNYTPAALLKMWPKHFTPDQAQQLGRTAQHPANQQAIADLAYGGRMGNNQPGDGHRFIGRGPIGITGRGMYERCKAAIGVDVVTYPDRLEDPSCGALSAAWFFSSHGCNALADDGDFLAITEQINGGDTGEDDRLSLWQKARNTLEA